MRSWRPPHRPTVAIPLAVAFLWSSVTLGGCNKVEEIAAKVGGEEDKDPEKEESKDSKDKDESKDEPKKEDEDTKVAEPEPIPVEPMHTGLDLMLSFVPDADAEFAIIRDASVLADYYEEGMRFVDAPLKKLAAAPETSSDLREVNEAYGVMDTKGKKVIEALGASGLRLKDGAAIINVNQDPVMIFAADDPNAVANLAKALGEDEADDMACGPLAGHEGWSVCADDQATLDAYKPADDPSAVRKALQDKLAAVALDDANVLVHMPSEDAVFAVTTLPGLVHLAGVFPVDKDVEQGLAALEGGETHTLANVQPGAGFAWGRANSALIGMGMAAAAGDAPPEVAKMFETMTGEFMIAGSVDPGGLVFQAGIRDVAPFSKGWELALEASKDAPKAIPELEGSELKIEKVPVNHGTKMADALHVELTGIPEADIVKAFAGLHFDGWAFAANNALTVAVGPNTANVGKLLDGSGDGISADTLASLPAPLAEGFKREEVAFAMHLPADFMQGEHLHKLLRAALKNVPDVDAETVIAGLALTAPVSSSSMWVEKPAGSAVPVLHMAVQGIGNRATDEGRAALDAAHRVTEGTAPAEAFAPLATKYGSSAMAFAYHTRAGSEGPGSLVGSGVGAVAVAGTIGYAAVSGLANETLAQDLGVNPSDPEPEIIPEHKPVVPEHTPVEPDEKKPDEKKPDEKKPDEKKPDAKKPDAKKPDAKKPDEKKDGPIVEPKKPPVPKPSIDDDAGKKKKGKKKKGKKKKGKKKKGKKKKKKG